MIDHEIIKALECCCSNKLRPCDPCPYTHNCGNGNNMKRDALDLINRQKAEIERFSDIGKMYSEIRAEAIKEFVEKVTAKLSWIPQHHFSLGQVLFDIDNLVKEMENEK